MERKRWYKDAVVYQIYTRSFNDSNGDGIGDLQGIRQKIDYIEKLGVNTVWLNPVYKSPNIDNGYDISDYRDIMDEFGTLEDWKELVADFHKRGIRVIMDFVFNSTSDEHNWFIESRKSKDNPYRDYYIWRSGKNNDSKIPPNNWTSFFWGSAWEYDMRTNEWYMHTFHKKQTELNWENPQVRREIQDIVNYWIDLGTDGFRCDVCNVFSKVYNSDGSIPDGENHLFFPVGTEDYIDGPRIHEFINELNTKCWAPHDCMTVGEAMGNKKPKEKVLSYIAESRNEFDMLFGFDHMDSDVFSWGLPRFRNNLRYYKKALTHWQEMTAKGAWNANFLENHDQPRCLSRYMKAFGTRRVEAAKVLATSYFMLRGTPFIYQGQELGMTNYHFKSTKDMRDCSYINLLNRWKYVPLAKYGILWYSNRRGRDVARTPMQWNTQPNAGFTTGTPWIKVNPNYKEINAEAELADENSIFCYYQSLINLKKSEKYGDIVRNGVYKEYQPNNKDMYIYERKCGGRKLVMVLNFKNKFISCKLPDEFKGKQAQAVLSNYSDGNTFTDRSYRPYEGVIYYLEEK